MNIEAVCKYIALVGSIWTTSGEEEREDSSQARDAGSIESGVEGRECCARNDFSFGESGVVVEVAETFLGVFFL